MADDELSPEERAEIAAGGFSPGQRADILEFVRTGFTAGQRAVLAAYPELTAEERRIVDEYIAAALRRARRPDDYEFADRWDRMPVVEDAAYAIARRRHPPDEDYNIHQVGTRYARDQVDRHIARLTAERVNTREARASFWRNRRRQPERYLPVPDERYFRRHDELRRGEDPGSLTGKSGRRHD